MPRILAVDWSGREARYVLASTSGSNLKVGAAGSVPLGDPAEIDGVDAVEVGKRLRTALADQKIGRPVTLVAVDRASVELLHFALPPASDAELPELVANQAVRESQSITETSVLDFVPAGGDPTEPRNVTVVALSSEQRQRLQSTCEAAGLTPARMLFRPYASAALFSRTAPTPERGCLLVNLLDDEVDFTVMDAGKPVLLRTVRLPNTSDETLASRRLLAEIRRTLVVSPQTKVAAESVQCVYVFGGPDEHQSLIDRISDELSLPAEVFDPFTAVGAAVNITPENPGRFASLLGMLLVESQGGRHEIDFLHPRRQPKPPNRKRMVAVAAALVAAVVLTASYFTWDTLSAADAENRELQKRLKELDELVKQAAKKQDMTKAVGAWDAGNVVWLDELRDLSLRFPTRRDAMVLRMSMSPVRGGGGAVTLYGLARDPSVVVQMEDRLRDEFHEVRTPRVEERVREKAYTWHFETSLVVSKRDKTEYISHLPGGQAGAPQAAMVEAETGKATSKESRENGRSR